MFRHGKIVVAASLCLVLLAAVVAFAAQPETQDEMTGVDLTVYNQNLAVVKDRRTLGLKAGVNEIAFRDVAKLIEPATVLFRSLTDPEGTMVLEQNYEYDLVGSQKLLEKYVDEEITLVTEDGSVYGGILLSGVQDVILQDEDGAVTLVRQDQVREFSFPGLPEGLITKPTLLWLVEAAEEGAHDIEVTYMTQGINWQADYVLLLNQEDTQIDLEGWITLNNNSGATYRDAKLKLIAGEIHRAQEALPYPVMVEEKALALDAGGQPQVEEREFFEYHLYEVQRPVTVKDRQTKQIEFTSASGASAGKFFVYDASQRPWYYYYAPITEPSYGQTSNREVMIMLEFDNSEDAGLGVPLPKGTVRVYKEDTDGSTQFIGEDTIDHTPKDETVQLYLGDAFDIIGERKQTDFRKPSARSIEESYEITIRNHKDEDVKVRVVEHMFRWSEWEIEETTDEYVKTDSRSIEYRVEVPSDGEETIEYTVRYRW